jgi:AcrR family transcriptional regulator
MGRWEPETRARLRDAALDLYIANGYADTTVAQIAESVGVTERTFFRHFADKREVLFGGTEQLQQEFVDGIAAAPTPLEMVMGAALHAAGFFPEERRPYSRRRQAVILANTELQERELSKMSGLAGALSAALREHGVQEPAASLAAESGVTVFRLAFEEWVAEGSTRTLVEIERDLFAALRGLAA